GVEFLEIPADGDRLGDAGAIVELQHRKTAERVAAQRLRRAVRSLKQIDLFGRDRDPLLGEKDANPTRIGREGEVVKLHADLHPPSWAKQPAWIGSLDCRSGERRNPPIRQLCRRWAGSGLRRD